MTIPVEIEEQKEEEIVVDGNSERGFPAPFYDSTTGALMTDPVVNPAGDSYDRSSITEINSVVTYYPNRALKSIIQQEVELSSSSLIGSVRRFDKALRTGWGRLMEKSAFGTEYRPLPDSFYCPITCDLITDPVISKDGISYEREAIENWIQVNGTSPVTRNPMTVAELRENNALYELIQKEKGRSLATVHPSIRRWRESGAPTSRRTMAAPISSESSNQQQQQPLPSAPPAPTPAVTTPPTVPGATTYPTTEAELRARRRQRANNSCGIAVLLATAAVIFFAFPMGGAVVFVAIFAVIVLLCTRACCRNTQRAGR